MPLEIKSSDFRNNTIEITDKDLILSNDEIDFLKTELNNEKYKDLLEREFSLSIDELKEKLWKFSIQNRYEAYYVFIKWLVVMKINWADNINDFTKLNQFNNSLESLNWLEKIEKCIWNTLDNLDKIMTDEDFEEELVYQEKRKELDSLLNNDYKWSLIENIINNNSSKESIEEEFKKIFAHLIYIDSDITKKLEELDIERTKIINWEGDYEEIDFIYQHLSVIMHLKIK